MSKFKPANLDQIGRYHRTIIDTQKEIETIYRNPQQAIHNFDFDYFNLRLLRLRLRDNLKTVRTLQNQ